MNDEPEGPEDVAEIAALPPDDPRRQAFARTARGRALIAEYDAFMRPGPAPPEAGLADAESRLAARLARELQAPAAGAGPPRTVRAAARPRPWWALEPVWRPALAFAALVIVAALVWRVAPRRPAPASELRGHQAGSSENGVTGIPLRPVRMAAGGAIVLDWGPVAGADRYQIELTATDLSALPGPPSVAAPPFTLSPTSLPAGLSHGQTVLWRVTAYRGGDAIGHSATAPLRLP
jgi:hypothetical protein